MRAYAGWLFGIAAATNAAVGLVLLLAFDWAGSKLGMEPAFGSNLALLYLTGGFILLFAYAYLRVALDPAGYRPVIGLAAIGKAAAFALVALAWALRAVDARVVALMAGDLVLAALFVDYLRRTRPQPREG